MLCIKVCSNGIKADLKNISVKTFTGDIAAPLSENDQNAVNILVKMLWGACESEVAEKERKDFKSLSDPNSDRYLLNGQHYYGFYTYTLFVGRK